MPEDNADVWCVSSCGVFYVMPIKRLYRGGNADHNYINGQNGIMQYLWWLSMLATLECISLYMNMFNFTSNKKWKYCTRIISFLLKVPNVKDSKLISSINSHSPYAYGGQTISITQTISPVCVERENISSWRKCGGITLNPNSKFH